MPAAVRTLVDDVEARAGRVRDLGLQRVVECTDAQLATPPTRDRVLGARCTRVGERHLLLDPADEEMVRAALLRLGHPLGPPTR